MNTPEEEPVPPTPDETPAQQDVSLRRQMVRMAIIALCALAACLVLWKRGTWKGYREPMICVGILFVIWTVSVPGFRRRLLPLYMQYRAKYYSTKS